MSLRRNHSKGNPTMPLPLDNPPVAGHADQPNLAPIFDPDEHCGADLPTGQPCTQDILRCDMHTFKQQSTFQGRSVGLADLERVDEANLSRLDWERGDDPFQYSPDTDCGATKPNCERCQGMLSCMWHSLKVKRAVPRDPPFQHKLTTLLRLQLLRVPSNELDSPWWSCAAEEDQDDQKDHISSDNGEGQQESAGEGGDEQEHSHGSPPSTPRWPSHRNAYTTSQDPISNALSPKTPRSNVSLSSLDTSCTSDGEQFTPTSSKDSLFGGKYEDAEDGSRAGLDAQEADLDAKEAALDAQEAQLQHDWAQLHQDQARGKLHQAQLQIFRDWEQVCQDQATQHHLEMQLLQDQAGQDRRKAQLYDQDRENRVAAQLLWDRDQEYRRVVQLRYDQDRAELDRWMRAQQMTDDEVTRLRTRAQRADELEQALDIQRGQKASLLQSIKDLRAGLKTRETSYQNELMFIASQSSAHQVQIQEIQESMEALVVEKKNVTALYQQDMAAKEAEINQLQEKTNAME
jgi:hypothetical protein